MPGGEEETNFVEIVHNSSEPSPDRLPSNDTSFIMGLQRVFSRGVVLGYPPGNRFLVLDRRKVVERGV